MPHYKYLLIGGGMTADAAVEGIRQVDEKGSIGVISVEEDPPYDRPPLTKGLWKDKPFESIWRSALKRNARLHLGRTATRMDLWRRQVTDDRGTGYSFDILLLATGGRPRRLPIEEERVIYFRTAADYRRLRELASKGKRFAVIGGGFIGSELAASLAQNQKEVVMVFRGKGIGAGLFPADLSQFLNEYYRQRGVEILADENVQAIERRGEHFLVKSKNHGERIVDGVVAGVGIEPNVELAQAAGLRVEEGIVVDDYLRTSHPDIYAAGDVASFFNPALGRRIRVEHEDNANTMGKLAGRNMAGYPQAYTHLPFFYSDLFDLGYEAVGETNPRLTTVADWKEPFREGVVYYQQDGLVRGVLLWNVWGQVDAARRLIAEHRPRKPEELQGQGLLKAA